MKKYLLMTIVFALALGTIAASLPAAEAQDTVRFYVWNATDSNNIYPSKTVGTAFFVEVWVQAPATWTNTANGIVQYALSVRVDPTVLEVVSCGQIPTLGGWLNQFILTEGDGSGFTWADLGAAVQFAGGAKDIVTGTLPDFTEYILMSPPIPAGAGGGPYKLMRIGLKSKSASAASVIDICGPPEAGAITVSAKLWQADGDILYVDTMDDGYYIAPTPDKMMLDFTGATIPYPPTGSLWHELWPTFCQQWSLESFTDNGDGIFSVTDQVDLTQTVGSSPGTVIWGHVEFLNPTPTPNDGRTDLILLKKVPTPEFPMGISLLLATVPMIAIVYVWRLRKRSR